MKKLIVLPFIVFNALLFNFYANNSEPFYGYLSRDFNFTPIKFERHCYI